MSKKWYIVHAYSNFEKKVAESICNEEPELANQLIERWISGSIAFADA